MFTYVERLDVPKLIVNLYIRGSQLFLARRPLAARVLFSVDPTVQQYAIKVTKRRPSRSLLDPSWEPLLYMKLHDRIINLNEIIIISVDIVIFVIKIGLYNIRIFAIYNGVDCRLVSILVPVKLRLKTVLFAFIS